MSLSNSGSGLGSLPENNLRENVRRTKTPWGATIQQAKFQRLPAKSMLRFRRFLKKRGVS